MQLDGCKGNTWINTSKIKRVTAPQSSHLHDHIIFPICVVSTLISAVLQKCFLNFLNSYTVCILLSFTVHCF